MRNPEEIDLDEPAGNPEEIDLDEPAGNPEEINLDTAEVEDDTVDPEDLPADDILDAGLPTVAKQSIQ